MERVAASKLELLEALPSGGTAVVNQGDPFGRELGDRVPRARVIRYGICGEGAQVRARDVRSTREGLELVIEADGHGEATFNVGVLGRHNVSNLLAATGAALALGMTLPEIAAAAARIEPVEHRLQPIAGAGGVLVIDDAFNSNPLGAAAALEVLAELAARQRILVTPGMVELAEREEDENRTFGRRAAGVCDHVIVVGRERAGPIVAGLREGGLAAERVHVVGSLGEATAKLGSVVGPGDVVLFENDLPDTYADVEVTPPTSNGARPTLIREVLEVDGHQVAYRWAGESGPPVVVLHGWGASIDAVASIQQGLADGRRVLALDLPGFGQSDPPPGVWGSNEYAELVCHVLDRLGLKRVSLIGHSRGGAIAIVIATRWPERVDRLVLVNSAGLRAVRSVRHRARVAVFKLARRLVGRGALGQRLLSRFGSADYRAAGQLRGTLVRLVNEDLRPLLPRVAAPTLLIWGDRDAETPLSDAAIMEREIPDAGLVIFPGAGHFAYADDPGRFAAVVGHFLPRSVG
jgi:pimeloyl-ACP methyl ester carboxylesterase